MASRFRYKALATAVLGIALSLLLAAPATASPAWSSTAGALQLDPPAAPSGCSATTYRERDRRNGLYKIWTVLLWNDNSTNEDGFTVETWFRDNGGA